MDNSFTHWNFIIACRDGDMKFIKEYHFRNNDIHAYEEDGLRVAIRFGNKRVVKYLLRHNAKININNGQLLHIAISNNKFDMIKLLINQGIKVDMFICQEFPRIIQWLSSPETLEQHEVASLIVKNRFT